MAINSVLLGWEGTSRRMLTPNMISLRTLLFEEESEEESEEEDHCPPVTARLTTMYPLVGVDGSLLLEESICKSFSLNFRACMQAVIV